MGFLDRWRRTPEPAEERYSMDDYAQWVGGVNFPYNLPGTLIQTWGNGGANSEPASLEYPANGHRMKSNGPVFTLMAIRLRLFSQVRWSYQELRKGRPGDLFSAQSLDILNDDPCLNQWMIRHVDLGGNFYGKVDQDTGKVWPLRPVWVMAMSETPLNDYDSEISGYAYFPGGMNQTKLEDAELFPASEIIHWMPEPDPDARWRGMSWLTPVIRELAADSKMTQHKEKFLDNSATANMILKFDKETSFENFEKFKDKFRQEHEGSQNAYKTLFLGGGADATVVGSDLAQLDFTAVQGKGETRLANAAGVHPVVAGFSEGMQGSSLNAGNFGQARRSTADILLHPLWVSAAGALGQVITPPVGARLWYDARDIPFLREDAKDDAEIRQSESVTIMNLVREGFEPGSVIDAVTSGDVQRLVHTGLLSVQLWDPGKESSKKPAPGSESPAQPSGPTKPANSTN